jgi:phospholipid transport system substrate-binding protein
MKKVFAFVASVFFATSVLAQEAPDVLVQQVSSEVLEIIRSDKDIQNGNTQKATRKLAVLK